MKIFIFLFLFPLLSFAEAIEVRVFQKSTPEQLENLEKSFKLHALLNRAVLLKEKQIFYLESLEWFSDSKIKEILKEENIKFYKIKRSKQF